MTPKPIPEPLRDYHERMMRAMGGLTAQGIDPRAFTVHLSKDTAEAALGEIMVADLRPAVEGFTSWFGVPIRFDEHLPLGEIVLRYEVRA